MSWTCCAGSMKDLPNIDEVVDLLGLQRRPGTAIDASTYSVKCPFCKDRHYHMHIDTVKGAYYCFRCCGGEKGLGVLDLYGKVRFGTPHQKGPGGNGLKLLTALRDELGKLDLAYQAAPIRSRAQAREKAGRVPSVPIASDDALDKAYSAILSFPEFRLSLAHRQALRARGLDDDSITRNGYATMPEDFGWIEHYLWAWDIYDKEDLETERQKFPKLRNSPKSAIVAGLIVAAYVAAEGIDLKGVPGAFSLKGYWCFMYGAGMLIPTRNRQGRIVALQTRKDKGKLRYLTVSASGLPYAVSEGISRTHFPLSNVSPAEAKEVLITEGPLKADVAACLYGQPVLIFALHGVGNTRQVFEICRWLVSQGVDKIGNAFDMDKLCNPNVRKASRKLRKILSDCHMSMYQKCWDEDHAVQKEKELELLCAQYGLVSVDKTGNRFVRISLMAEALDGLGVEIWASDKEGGVEYWAKETKGIDDYLLQCKKKAEKKVS